jgi:tape measure domain-containing protein
MDIQRLRLIIDSAPAAEGAAQWSRYTKQVSQDAVSATGEIVKMESAIDSVARSMRMAAQVAGVGFGVAKVIEYADTWKLVEGRLRIVTDGTRDLHGVQTQLFDISQKTRTSYEDIADTYARIARSTRDLKVSEKELLSVTETLSKAITISGVTTQQARMGMIQLGQAFAIGRLQGQDMRMLFEDIPRVGLAISEGLNIPIGKLKEMGSQGKLTSEMVLRGLTNAKESIDREFIQMPMTVGQSLTQVTNAMQKFIGEQDHGIGATAALSGAISLLARNFNLLGNAALLFGAAKLAGLLSGLITPTLQETKALATGNAVLLDSREAHLMRAAAAKEAAVAEISASQNAQAGLRAELALITELQMAERRRFAEAALRVKSAVPSEQVAPLGGAVQMRDNAAVVMAMKQRAESEATLAALQQRRMQTTADLAAVEVVEMNAQRASTAANIAGAMAAEVSTVAMVAEAVAARGAALATGMFKAAMSLVGGPVGVAILALTLFVGWLLKKQQAEADAIDQTIKHTAAMQEQSVALKKLHDDMVEDITDIDKQAVALQAKGLKGLDQAKEEIKARDLARKYWKAYQEALKDDTGHDAEIARQLDIEHAMKSSSAAVRAAALNRVEMAGLVVGANAALVKAEKEAKDAAEKAKTAREEHTRKLKEEAEARKKATGDVTAEMEAVKLNSMAAGDDRVVRERWALVAKINTEIHNKHAEAALGDSEAVAKDKAALRDHITTTLIAVDSIDRMTKARNGLKDSLTDIDVEVKNAQDMAVAYRQGAAAVEQLKIEQAADAAIRRETINLSAAEIAQLKPQLDQYRQKLVLLGQLNAANQAASQMEKQDIQLHKEQAKKLATEVADMTKNALKDAQRAVAAFFESVLSGGVNSFQKLVSAMRDMFVKLFAEFATMKLGQFIVNAMQTRDAANHVANGLLRGGTNNPHLSGAQQAGLYGASGLGGFTLGYGIGQSTSNQGIAALGGAASGALAGAVIAGPVGAVVGGVAGLVGGLLGSAAKIRAERDALAKARQEFFEELDKFVFGIGEHSGLEKNLHDLQESLDAVAKKNAEVNKPVSDKTLEYLKNIGVNMTAYYEKQAAATADMKRAADAAAAAAARMKKEFLDSIDAQIRAVDGKGYINDALDAQKAYQANLKDVVLAGGDASKATELFTKQLDQLAKGLSVDQIQDLMKQLPALTNGMDPASAAALATVLKNDLADALKAAANAAALAAETLLRASEALQVRYGKALGNNTDLMALQFSQRQEYTDAESSGASPAYLAQLKLVQLYELAQLKVQQQTDAQVKTISEASRAEQQRLDGLIKTARDSLQVQQDALSTAQSNLDETQKVVQSLTDYSRSLITSDLSPLSPAAQYSASKQDLQDAFVKALAGDKASAGMIPDLANTFLRESRNFNASGPNYALDFAGVQDMLAKLQTKYGEQQTAEQQLVDHAQQQIDLLQQQIDQNTAAQQQNADDTAAQIAALQDVTAMQEKVKDEVVKQLQAQQDAALETSGAQIDLLTSQLAKMDDYLAASDAQLYALVDQKQQLIENGATETAELDRQIAETIATRLQTQAVRDKVNDQLLAAQAARAEFKAASDAEIAAVQSGATFQQQAARSLEVLLTAQHLEEIAAQQKTTDQIVAAVMMLYGDSPDTGGATDTHGTGVTNRPRFNLTTGASYASVPAAGGNDDALLTELRAMNSQLVALRQSQQTAGASTESLLGDLNSSFDELVQQVRLQGRGIT